MLLSSNQHEALARSGEKAQNAGPSDPKYKMYRLLPWTHPFILDTEKVEIQVKYCRDVLPSQRGWRSLGRGFADEETAIQFLTRFYPEVMKCRRVNAEAEEE
jgi:hypothetical protein